MEVESKLLSKKEKKNEEVSSDSPGSVWKVYLAVGPVARFLVKLFSVWDLYEARPYPILSDSSSLVHLHPSADTGPPICMAKPNG